MTGKRKFIGEIKTIQVRECTENTPEALLECDYYQWRKTAHPSICQWKKIDETCGLFKPVVNEVALNDWLYIYYVSLGGKQIFYDRSMPRKNIYEADRRVRELRKRGKEAFYTIGGTFKGAFC